VLNARLEAAVAAVDACRAPSLQTLFEPPDDRKFCSSMTLFAIAAPDGPYQALNFAVTGIATPVALPISASSR
jgi:uncharacterized protein (DUF1810 family)